MNVLISGINGFMGQELVKLVNANENTTLVGGVDVNDENKNGVLVAKGFENAKTVFANEKIDVIIDFSHHTVAPALMSYALEIGATVIVATTGHTDEEKQIIKDASKSIPVFYSANMSLGVALLVALAKKTASAFPDAEIEIVESHHDRKLDAPSGTALMIADAICSVRPSAFTVCGRSGSGKRTKQEIGIHALRLGNIVGIHEVIVNTGTQAITLKHEAYTRALFAEGAVSACIYMQGKDAGLYDMSSMVQD